MCFQQTHNQGLRLLFLKVSWDLRTQRSTPDSVLVSISEFPEESTPIHWFFLKSQQEKISSSGQTLVSRLRVAIAGFRLDFVNVCLSTPAHADKNVEDAASGLHHTIGRPGHYQLTPNPSFLGTFQGLFLAFANQILSCCEKFAKTSTFRKIMPHFFSKNFTQHSRVAQYQFSLVNSISINLKRAYQYQYVINYGKVPLSISISINWLP